MKLMKYSNELLNEIVEKFKKQIINENNYTGTRTLKFDLPSFKLEQPIILNYTGLAWLKMRTLVEKCPKEIAWQGVVITNEDHTRFDVVDILVYPQKIAAATVEMNDDKYEPWHQALPNAIYNNLRLQGHSHVNMATSPSGVDTAMYDELLSVIRDTSFYIFMIANKAGSYWYRIFDKKNNKIYANEDIKITIDDVILNDWYDTMFKTNIIDNTPKYSAWDHTKYFSAKNNYAPVKSFIPENDPIGFDETPEYTDPFYETDDPKTVQKVLNKTTSKIGKPKTKTKNKGGKH